MDVVPLNCSQCGGHLPRQAMWRTVDCPFCGATVTRCASMVDARRFHDALRRYINEGGDAGAANARCGGRQYQMVRLLYEGSSSRVVLARRAGRLGEHVVLKYADAAKLERECAVLVQLHHDAAPGAAYYMQRLPYAVALGRDDSQQVLVLRHHPGYWGSLADVGMAYTRGLDARHVVWMWRRTLEVLAYVHAGDWCHGRVAPEHLLVHPGDHGVLLTGWSQAMRHGDQARDLMQSAWSMRALLAGPGAGHLKPAIPASTPGPVAEVLERGCADYAWVQKLGAQGIHRQLTAAAEAAFGPPRFIPFNPKPSITP